MADDKVEKQDRLRQVLKLQELYHGRFTQADIRTLLDENDWEDGQVISFIQENEPATVRQAVQRLSEDQIKEIQSDPNIARALADGVATETRLFACKDCDRFWWRRVPSRKQVSKCHRCHVKYDPVPEENEWGWAIYNCECGNEFSGHGQRQVGSECYRCRSIAYPTEIRPPSRRRKKRTRFRHSCNAPDCDGHGDDVTGGGDAGATGQTAVIYDRNSGNQEHTAYVSTGGGDGHYEPRGRYQPYQNTGPRGSMVNVCVSPESRQGKPKVIVASVKHVSTGSTVATFLDQDDLCSLDSYVTSLPVITE